MKKKHERFWLITGWNSTTKIFEQTVPSTWIGEKKIKHLLQALVAKHSLNPRETLACYLNKNVKASSNLLEVRKDGLGPNLECGQNPYFTAVVVDENCRPVRFRKLH